MIVEVYDVLGVQDHPAAAMFDTQELVDAAGAAFGRLPESDEQVTWIAVPDPDGEVAGIALHPWTGQHSAVVHVSGPFGWLRPTIDGLLPLVVERHLMLYDAQTRTVYNNRRQYPS